MAKKKSEKKYGIVYCLGILENGAEDLYQYDADYWMEDLLANGSIIVMGDLEKDEVYTIPSSQLRRIHQKFGVKEDVERFAQFNEKMKRRKELMEVQAKKDNNVDVV